jgi:hypothetical protein
MWETIYTDLVRQLGGPVGAFAWASGWACSYGLYRVSRFLYSELSREKERNAAINSQIMNLSAEFNRTTADLNRTIQHFQDRVTLDEALKSALTEFMAK